MSFLTVGTLSTIIFGFFSELSEWNESTDNSFRGPGESSRWLLGEKRTFEKSGEG